MCQVVVWHGVQWQKHLSGCKRQFDLIVSSAIVSMLGALNKRMNAIGLLRIDVTGFSVISQILWQNIKKKTQWTHMLRISFTQIREKNCINLCRVPCTVRFQRNERKNKIKELHNEDDDDDDDGEQRTKPPPYPNIIWLLEMVNISSQQYNSSQRRKSHRAIFYHTHTHPVHCSPSKLKLKRETKKWNRATTTKKTQLILFVLCDMYKEASRRRSKMWKTTFKST